LRATKEGASKKKRGGGKRTFDFFEIDGLATRKGREKRGGGDPALQGGEKGKILDLHVLFLGEKRVKGVPE